MEEDPHVKLREPNSELLTFALILLLFTSRLGTSPYIRSIGLVAYTYIHIAPLNVCYNLQAHR
jgi:hypothetical protein